MDIIIFWMHNSSPHICKGQSKLKWREDVRHISTSDIQLTCRPLPIARTELFNTKVNFSHDGHKLGLEHITLHAIHREIVAKFCFLYNYTQKDSSETFPISTAFRLQCPPILLPHRTKFFQSPSSLWVIPRVSTILHNVYNKDLNMAWFTRFWRETYVEVTNCRRWWKSYSSTSTLRRRTTSRIAAIQYNSASFQKDAMTRNSSCTELQLVKCKLCEEEKLFSNDNGSVHMKKEHLRPAAKTQECLYGCVLLSFQSFSMICDLFFAKLSKSLLQSLRAFWTIAVKYIKASPTKQAVK